MASPGFVFSAVLNHNSITILRWKETRNRFTIHIGERKKKVLVTAQSGPDYGSSPTFQEN